MDFSMSVLYSKWIWGAVYCRVVGFTAYTGCFHWKIELWHCDETYAWIYMTNLGDKTSHMRWILYPYTSSLTGLIKKYEPHIDNTSLEMFQTACFPPPHDSTIQQSITTCSVLPLKIWLTVFQEFQHIITQCKIISYGIIWNWPYMYNYLCYCWFRWDWRWI